MVAAAGGLLEPILREAVVVNYRIGCGMFVHRLQNVTEISIPATITIGLDDVRQRFVRTRRQPHGIEIIGVMTYVLRTYPHPLQHLDFIFRLRPNSLARSCISILHTFNIL